MALQQQVKLDGRSTDTSSLQRVSYTATQAVSVILYFKSLLDIILLNVQLKNLCWSLPPHLKVFNHLLLCKSRGGPEFKSLHPSAFPDKGECRALTSTGLSTKSVKTAVALEICHSSDVA